MNIFKEKKNVTISFFGGSITEGAGASDESKCYRGLVTSWLKEKYGDFKSVNSAIGGTGSSLGAFRCDNDVLAYKPDLVFVEFAVNDYGSNDEEIKINMETIVRKLKAENVKIAFIFTVTNEIGKENYDIGKIPHTVQIHTKIAEYYKIPYINIGEMLWNKIKDENLNIKDLLPDLVHPSDMGYQIYFEFLKPFIENLVFDDYFPKAMNDNLRMSARLVDSFVVNADGWKKEEISLHGRYPRYISSNIANSEFSFEFVGDTIGLYWLMASDSGDILWSVDESEWELVSSWDKYSLEFDRVNYVILKTNLEKTNHILKLKVSPEKQEQSKGNYIRIGAFLVN